MFLKTIMLQCKMLSITSRSPVIKLVVKYLLNIQPHGLSLLAAAKVYNPFVITQLIFYCIF